MFVDPACPSQGVCLLPAECRYNTYPGDPLNGVRHHQTVVCTGGNPATGVCPPVEECFRDRNVERDQYDFPLWDFRYDSAPGVSQGLYLRFEADASSGPDASRDRRPWGIKVNTCGERNYCFGRARIRELPDYTGNVVCSSSRSGECPSAASCASSNIEFYSNSHDGRHPSIRRVISAPRTGGSRVRRAQ